MSELRKPTSLPEIEQSILEFWDREEIFQKTVALRNDAEPFVFYDGPPFANGMPHHGHIAMMAIKDAVLRYKTMQGYKVPRKIGWDTHGLPVEYETEKELNLSGKRDIEAYGIHKFVDAAQASVLRYTKEWEATMQRMGRWMDLTHPYTTMDRDYMESVWWAFHTLHEKGLVYKDYRVSPYCPRCGTVLSNFEVNQGYKDDTVDPSAYVAVRVTAGLVQTHGAWIVIWTTTPWTLPSNVALAVDPKSEYVVVESEGKNYVVAKKLVEKVFPDGTIIGTKSFSGEELVGTTYEPLYRQTDDPKAYRVIASGHVTMDDGTGVVHIAPAYGEDDYVLGKTHELPLIQTVMADGTVLSGKNIPGEGLFVKDADSIILDDLRERGLLVRRTTLKHTYPFCWRCDTPLLYYPTTSWYVKVSAFREELINENEQINWQPAHLRDGRFGKWLEGARDWAISRDRYWGAPIPVWECDTCETFRVFGSIKALVEMGANEADLTDLHRPAIDNVTLPCSCGGTMRRISHVFDCWFESGSMPFAQEHYPFSGTEVFNPDHNENYPAHFIAEALDQTRGWFYTLHVLGVGLFGKRAYDAVVTSGLILAPDGRKLSKKLRNYTEPNEIFNTIGVDPLRLFIFTATSLGEDYRFSDQAVRDVQRRWLTPLLNVVTYWQLSKQDSDDSVTTEPAHALLDTWILARIADAHKQIIDAMEGDGYHPPFDIVRACRTFGPLVEDISTWYVRLSRGRQDSSFTQTLGEVLMAMSRLYAPFMPFIAEHIYQVLKNEEMDPSVHMAFYSIPKEWSDATVIESMRSVQTVVTLGRELRATHKLPLRQPLATLQIVESSAEMSDSMLDLIAQELQIDTVETVGRADSSFVFAEGGNVKLGLDTRMTDDLKDRGEANELRRIIQDLRKQSGLQPKDKAFAFVASLDERVGALVQSQLASTHIVYEAANEPLLAKTKEGEREVVLFAHVQT